MVERKNLIEETQRLCKPEVLADNTLSDNVVLRHLIASDWKPNAAAGSLEARKNIREKYQLDTVRQQCKGKTLKQLQNMIPQPPNEGFHLLGVATDGSVITFINNDDEGMKQNAKISVAGWATFAEILNYWLDETSERSKTLVGNVLLTRMSHSVWNSYLGLWKRRKGYRVFMTVGAEQLRVGIGYKCNYPTKILKNVARAITTSKREAKKVFFHCAAFENLKHGKQYWSHSVVNGSIQCHLASLRNP